MLGNGPALPTRLFRLCEMRIVGKVVMDYAVRSTEKAVDEDGSDKYRVTAYYYYSLVSTVSNLQREKPLLTLSLCES